MDEDDSGNLRHLKSVRHQEMGRLPVSTRVLKFPD